MQNTLTHVTPAFCIKATVAFHSDGWFLLGDGQEHGVQGLQPCGGGPADGVVLGEL